MSSTARSTRAWFSARFSQRLTPDGCGSGTATASPSSNRSPTAASRLASPRSRRIARPPTAHDQPRPKEPKLPLAPELAQLLLASRGRPVAAASRRTARVAARHRGAVERRVELVLVHRQPAPQRLPGAPAPRPSLLSLDHSRRLSEDVRPLARMPLEDRERLDRDTPPRRTRGNGGCHAAARRASGTTSAAASRVRAHDDEPVPVEEDLAAAQLLGEPRAPTK